MKRFLCLFLCLIPLSVTLAQTPQVDSLTAELETATDTTRVHLLRELAFALRRSDPDQALAYGQEALSLAEQVGDTKGGAFALNNMGLAHYSKGDYAEALSAYQRARVGFEEIGAQRELGYVFNNIGRVYRNQSRYADAIRFYERSLEMREAVGDERGRAIALRDIGAVYRSQGSFVEAFDYFQRSLQVREALGDQRSTALALTDIGAVHMNRGDHADAVPYFQRALEAFEALGDQINQAIVLNNLGAVYRRQDSLDAALATYQRALQIVEEAEGVFILNNTATVYRLQGRYAEALDYLQRARQILEENSNRRSLANTLHNTGLVYSAQGRHNQALDYGLQSLAMAQEVGAKAFIGNASVLLHESYAALGNYREAYRYLQLTAAYRDSLSNEEQAREVGRLESQYVFDKQRQQEAQEREQAQRLARQRRRRNMVLLLGGLGFLVVMLTAGAFHVRTLRRKNAVIRDQKQEAEELAQQAAVASQAKSTFLANISHEFRTPLTLTFGPLDDLANRRFASIDDALPHIERARRNGSRLLRLINQLLDLSKLDAGALLLRPQRRDLAQHLRQLAALFDSIAEMQDIHYTTRIPDEPLWHVYDADKIEKVVINLLSNAFKFTPTGSKVAVVLEREEDGTARIVVADRGSGIPEEHVPHLFDRFYQVEGQSTRAHEGSGIGLALVKELVELHEGTIEVESTVGFGMRFMVRLPSADLEASPEVADEQEAPSPTPEAALLDLVPTRPEGSAPSESEAADLVESARPDSSGGLARSHAAIGETIVLVIEDSADMREYIHPGDAILSYLQHPTAVTQRHSLTHSQRRVYPKRRERAAVIEPQAVRLAHHKHPGRPPTTCPGGRHIPDGARGETLAARHEVQRILPQRHQAHAPDLDIENIMDDIDPHNLSWGIGQWEHIRPQHLGRRCSAPSATLGGTAGRPVHRPLELLTLRQPAQHGPISLEVDAMAAGPRLPHPAHLAVLRSQMPQERDILQLTRGVRSQIPELIARPDVDAPLPVNGQREGRPAMGQANQAPGDPVVLEHTGSVAEIHDPALIFEDRPVLAMGAVVIAAKGLEGWQAYVRRRVRGPLGVQELGSAKN